VVGRTQSFSNPHPYNFKTYELKKTVKAFLKPIKHAVHEAIKRQEMLAPGRVNSNAKLQEPKV